MEPRKQTFLYLTTLFCVWRVLAITSTATTKTTTSTLNTPTEAISITDNKLYGLHSDELKSGHLVVPKKVNQNGEFLTHKLTHHHVQHYRSKRGLHNNNINNVEDIVHYQIDVNNETLHLELEPHSYFMTPHLIVERHRRDLRTRKEPVKNTNCHFHGKIRGHHESRVAISTCGGLVGHIITQSNEYYIEPSKNHDEHPTDGHPHVLFHRSSVKEKQHHNKVKRKRHQHRQQRHHHQRQARRRKPLSNCGTKEPRRRMETRLEWQTQGKVKIQGGRKIRRHHQHNNKQQQHKHQHKQQQQLLQQQQNDRPQAKYNMYRTAEDVTAPIASLVVAPAPAVTATKTKTIKSAQQYEINENYDHSNNNIKISNKTTKQLKSTTTMQTSSSPRTTSAAAEPQISSLSSAAAAAAATSKMSATMNNRMKRSISSPRHVETLIVADTTMVAFHNDVETYLLTIMNMVSSLYKDPSIGNSIEIVVVKIILLEEDEAHPDLNLTQNAQQNLDAFCRWQHKLNAASENDPHHHDVAILITRKNICGNNCMTLGLANVGGMCKPKQSCSVNEDNGIMLSHTIAHELGHNFGMFHDTAKIGCFPRIGSIVHIMTPTFGADTLEVCWSNCSRKYITHFLDQGLGDCLDDAPAPIDQYVYPEVAPGVIYNAELQCRLQFNVTDADVATCSSMNEICSTLWCRVNGECVTNMRPTAPGTSCGKRKWCQSGKCVRMEEISPIDGGWGNWTEWSVCSRTCGGGVSIQQRECDNPVPAHGGVFCIGERKRYKICNIHACPPNEPNFRGKQCSSYDNVPYQGAKYKWLPFFDKKSPCKLFCTDADDTIIANWGDVVLNGTPCKLGTYDMCIDGICKNVGCDWQLDSELKEDRCGICGGNGDQCKPVKEVFNEPLNVTEGYVEVVVIPAKARHIVIKELSNSPNFLGIAKANSSKFYLNGDSLISMPGEFIIAGAESLYDRIDEKEIINIPQPIKHSIALYIIVRSRDFNDGIYYEFTLPAVNANTTSNYSWKLSDWTLCSATCGGGVQYREPQCYENGNLISENEICWSHARNARPKRRTRSCNENQCPAHWLVGSWQFCPVTCKQRGAPLPVKRRSVMCLDQNDIVVSDGKCNQATRPTETEYCDQNLPNCATLDNKILET